MIASAKDKRATSKATTTGLTKRKEFWEGDAPVFIFSINDFDKNLTQFNDSKLLNDESICERDHGLLSYSDLGS